MACPAAEDIPVDVSVAVIPLNQITYMDTTNDTIHVYRLGFSKLHFYLKDSKFNIALVAHTVMKYGDKDNKHKSGCRQIINFRVNTDYCTTTMETIKVKLSFSITTHFEFTTIISFCSHMVYYLFCYLLSPMVRRVWVEFWILLKRNRDKDLFSAYNPLNN